MGNISGGGHERLTSKSMDEPEITSPRIRLIDGRYLAYRETGVPKEEANFKIIIVHGFGSSKEMSFTAPQVNTLNSLSQFYFIAFFSGGVIWRILEKEKPFLFPPVTRHRSLLCDLDSCTEFEF